MNNHEEIAKMIDGAELTIEKDEKSARRKVISLSLLGYGYFVLLLLFGLIGIAATLTALYFKGHFVLLKILLGFLFFTGYLLRALYAPPYKPDGVLLKQSDAPEFIAKVKQLSQELQSIKISKIYITAQYNASVYSQRMFGFFGPSRHILQVGMPFFICLREEELLAVIGHEFGHLSKKHTKFNVWTYRNINLWLDIYQRGKEKGSWLTSIMVNKFVNYFVPKLYAYSVVFSRSMEYDADRFSGEIFGNNVIAQALTKVYVLDSYHREQFWAPLYRKSLQIASVFDVEPMTLLADFAQQSLDNADCGKILAGILTQSTLPFNSHPCLSDRLSALGETAQLEQQLNTNTAMMLLGDFGRNCIAHFNSDWQIQVEGYWNYKHHELLEAKSKLEQYDVKGFDNLEELEQLKYIDEMVILHGVDSVISLYEKILEKNPNNPHAIVLKARHFLKTDPELAAPYYEKLIDDKYFSIEACHELYEYYHQLGDRESAYRYLKLLTEKQEFNRAAEAERELYDSDRFSQHHLDENYLHTVIEALKLSFDVNKAYLVQKVLRYRPEAPHYVLLVKSKKPLSSSEKSQLAHKIDIPEAATMHILSWKDLNRVMRKRITRQEAALIYS